MILSQAVEERSKERGEDGRLGTEETKRPKGKKVKRIKGQT